MEKKYKTFLLFVLVWLSYAANRAKAQQVDIPGVTDITNVTTVSSHTPTSLFKFLKESCQDSARFTRQVQDWKGTIGYREDLKSYVISGYDPTIVYAPNTVFFCGYYTTYIICNWPDAATQVGRLITFSGRWARGPSSLKRHAGERLLYLYLTSVR